MDRLAYAAILLSSSILSACITKPSYVIDSQAPLRGTVSDTAIAIVDKRPDKDRESSIGSVLVTSSSFGIHTIGDERFVPAPLTAFSQKLQRSTATWPARPKSITLTVNRLNIQNNVQASARHSAISSSGLTSLGMDFGELMLGKMREQNIDQRKPFILCVIDANAEVLASNGSRENRKINVVKAQNYEERTTQEQMNKVIEATVSSALDVAIAAVAK